MFVLPDTNFFLHYVHPSQAPWADLGIPGDVRIVVVRSIQSEIDRKKHELRGRALARAREFAPLFLKAALDGPQELRAGSPRVTLEYSGRTATDVPPRALADATWGDDAFVADALDFMTAHPDQDVLLLSGDAGPLLTARAHGVPFRSLSETGWELPPEGDDRGRRMAELERRIVGLERQEPVLEAAFDVGHRVELRTVRHDPLPDGAVEALMEELAATHPRATSFEAPPGDTARTAAGVADGTSDPVAPTPEEVATYHRAYDDWLWRARELFGSLPGRLDTEERSAAVALALTNVGAAPAERVLVSLRTTGDLLLLFRGGEEDGEQLLVEDDLPGDGGGHLGPPPTPPQRRRAPSAARPALGDLSGLEGFRRLAEVMATHDRLVGKLDGLVPVLPSPSRAVLDGIHPVIQRFPRPRDPETFHYRVGEEGGASGHVAFECERFRHRGAPERFAFDVSFPLGSTARGGQVNVEVHAANLREPVRARLAVVRVRERRTPKAEAREALGLRTGT